MNNAFKKFLDSIEFYILVLIFFILIWFFVLSPRAIDGISMFPYFYNNDFILVDKTVYLYSKPERGDVVVFKHSATQDYIKRVIGMPNDIVMVRNGNVYINDKLLDEPYLTDDVRTSPGAALREGIPYTVPERQYLLMGDNRPSSTDSREFGAVPLEYIEGRAVIVWYPLDRMKMVPRGSKVYVSQLSNSQNWYTLNK